MVHGPWTHNTLVQLVLIGTCRGQQVVNVHHFEASGIKEALLLDDATAQALGGTIAQRWEATCKAGYLGCHTQDYTLVTLRHQVLERPGLTNHKLVAGDRVPGGGVIGTNAANADDLATCGVVRWKSTLAGKAHRGRSYIGPWYDSAIDSGLVTAGAVAQLQIYADALMALAGPTGTDAGDFRLTAYSRPYSAGQYQYTRRVGHVLTVVTPPDYVGNSTFITAAQVDNVARVQRRREIGVGA